MVRSIGQKLLASCLSLGMSACATVQVPAKQYVARATVQGGAPAKKESRGRGLAPELKKTGVLWAGDKIAVLPGYGCDIERNPRCYAEIDALETALVDAGFWVEHWRELRADEGEDRFAVVKARGIEHALMVDDYRLQVGDPGAIHVGEISLVEQQDSKQPRPLKLKPKEWKVVGPRCINHFRQKLGQTSSAPSANMAVRLISVAPERVLWTRKFYERGADTTQSMELFHDVPKQVKQKKTQRYWGIGMAATGVALGIGAGVGARRMSTSSTLIMAGLALISTGLGSWLVYDSRPREMHAKGPVDVLCNPSFASKSGSSKNSASSVFAVHRPGADGDSPAIARARKLEASLINEVSHQVSLLSRSKWDKPKKKKKDKKKDKSGKDEDLVSAMSCRWNDQKLECKAACTRCKDPWEGPCEICRPPKKEAVPVMVVTQAPAKGEDKADKKKSKKKPKQEALPAPEKASESEQAPAPKPGKSKPAKPSTEAKEDKKSEEPKPAKPAKPSKKAKKDKKSEEPKPAKPAKKVKKDKKAKKPKAKKPKPSDSSSKDAKKKK